MRLITLLLNRRSLGAGSVGRDHKWRGSVRCCHGNGATIVLAFDAVVVVFATVGRHAAAVVDAEDVVVLTVEHGAQVVGHAEPQRLLLTYHRTEGASCTPVSHL